MYEAHFEKGQSTTNLKLTAIGNFGDGENRAKIRELWERKFKSVVSDCFVWYDHCWFSEDRENEIFIDSYHGSIWIEFDIYRRAATNGNTPELTEADIKSMNKHFCEQIAECVEELKQPYPEAHFGG